MLGKRIEGLDLALMERVDNLVMVEVGKEKGALVGTPYNPNPCTPRTPHPPTKEQTLEPSARNSLTFLMCHLYVILYLCTCMHVMALQTHAITMKPYPVSTVCE